MRERVCRIESDGFLEQSHRFLQVFRRPFGPEVTAFQVQVVRLGAPGRHRNQRRLLEEPGSQRVGDGGRKLVLDGKDVLQLPIVRLRPQVISVGCVDQLRGEAQGVAFAADASLQHGGDGELLADLPHAQVLVLVRECRGARDDAQTFDVGERVDHLFGDAVREVFFVLRLAEVRERQHGDRRSRGYGGSGRGPGRPGEVPRDRRHDCERGDDAQRQGDAHASRTFRADRNGPLDPPRRHVEDPGQHDHDGKSDGEAHHHERKRPIGQPEPVHDWLDDLEHGERDDRVPHEGAEDAPSLQLRDQRDEHPASVSHGAKPNTCPVRRDGSCPLRNLQYCSRVATAVCESISLNRSCCCRI